MVFACLFMAVVCMLMGIAIGVRVGGLEKTLDECSKLSMEIGDNISEIDKRLCVLNDTIQSLEKRLSETKKGKPAKSKDTGGSLYNGIQLNNGPALFEKFQKELAEAKNSPFEKS